MKGNHSPPFPELVEGKSVSTGSTYGSVNDYHEGYKVTFSWRLETRDWLISSLQSPFSECQFMPLFSIDVEGQLFGTGSASNFFCGVCTWACEPVCQQSYDYFTEMALCDPAVNHEGGSLSFFRFCHLHLSQFKVVPFI